MNGPKGRADRRALAAIGGAIAILAGGLWRPHSAEAAFPGANGKIAFYSTRDGNHEIYVMDADGMNPTNLTNNAASDVLPAFSSDGTKIAFTSDRDGNNEIYVMDADGANPTRLTNNAASDFDPAFSPDGTKIAFQSTRDGNSEVYVMDADGTNQTNLTNNAGLNNNGFDGQPAFSPEGTKIAFTTYRGGCCHEIYVMDADGSDQTNLTNSGPDDNGPDFSPDGTKIAFYSIRDGNQEIYVMDADGTDQTNLTNNAAFDILPAFSPDGTKIAFTTNRDGSSEIFVMDADGTGQTNLTNHAAIDQSPDWGPARADLRLAKSDNPDPAVQGDNIVYTITVTNDGPDDATDVVVTDVLPISFLSAVPTQGSCDEFDGTVTCDLGTLANGASATVTITVTASSAEIVTNQASVEGAEFDPQLADNTDAESTTVLPVSGSGEVAVSGHAHRDVNASSDVDAGDVHVEANVLRDAAPSANPNGVISFRDGRANAPGKAAKVAFECTELNPTKLIVLAPNKVKVKGTVSGCTPGTPASFKKFVATFTDLGANPPTADKFSMKFLNKKNVVKYEQKFTSTVDMGDLAVTT